ncbi:MAG: Concanavalin A-like lectin/glucanase superfamily protein, partial [Verrucomicrobiales bacterium]|nr:Concanavalin A-like lectin/glucanase superfamily protein [Verrucomicrobiales bacterium]
MRFPEWLLAGTILLSASISHAAMTAVRFYHLGEGDAGVGHTVAATNSLDSVSTNALTLTGAPKYWAHAAPGNTNSTFSLLFSTTNQGTAAIVSDTNNVCLESWANTGWRSTHVVAYNGNRALDGYGLLLETNTYKAVLGGVGTVGTVPCPPGEWMHLALVCSNGTAKFFTNGVLAAAINATPNPPTGT